MSQNVTTVSKTMWSFYKLFSTLDKHSNGKERKVNFSDLLKQIIKISTKDYKSGLIDKSEYNIIYKQCQQYLQKENSIYKEIMRMSEEEFKPNVSDRDDGDEDS